MTDFQKLIAALADDDTENVEFPAEIEIQLFIVLKFFIGAGRIISTSIIVFTLS